MMNRRLGAWCLLLAGALAVGPVLAQDDEDAEEEEAAEFATLSATLTPGEVPETGGVAGASATFKGEFDSGTGDVCFVLSVRGLRDAGEAHIHRGEPGRDGSTVIALDEWADGDICIAKQPKDINGILGDAPSHYVDVHLRSNRRTVAIRGQLAKAS